MSIYLKTLLIVLIGLSLASSAKICHKSCTCDDDTYVCNGCSDPNGDPLQLWLYGNRFCPCADGFYVSNHNDWTCSPNPVAQDFDWCQEQLVYQSLNVVVQTDCHMENIEGANYVVSNIDLDYNGFIEVGGCMD